MTYLATVCTIDDRIPRQAINSLSYCFTVYETIQCSVEWSSPRLKSLHVLARHVCLERECGRRLRLPARLYA